MTMRMVEFSGRFRRLIDLKAWDETTVVGWLEDDHHHFGVTLVHDGRVVKDVRIATPRHPWATCPSAGAPLRALIGQPLLGRCSDIGTLIDMRRQCTHLYDLTGLLLAHAYHRRDHRRYDATVVRLDAIEPSAPAGWLHAELQLDGQKVLWWDISGETIMRPQACAGQPTDRGFREWIETMDEPDAEHAFVLRRAVFVSRSRTVDLSDVPSADAMNFPAVCHTYQQEQRVLAFAMPNSIRRFDKDPEAMLAQVDTKP